MRTAGKQLRRDYYTRAANDDCIKGGSSTRTKYTYDLNGNAITRNGSPVSWTSYNYPSSVSANDVSGTETVAFSYGPNRQRWQQNYNSGTEVTNYIGGLLEQVASGGITSWRHYIYAGNEPVAVYSRTSTLVNAWNYFLSNQEGSITAVTNSSGAIAVNEDFSAFGARRNPTTWSGAPTSGDLTTIAGLSRQGYTFQTALGQTMGLNHMNGRVQDAITGRFLSPDVNIPDPTNTQDYNRYSYVVNNPLTYLDPTGFGQCELTGSENEMAPLDNSDTNASDNLEPPPKTNCDPVLPEVVVPGYRDPPQPSTDIAQNAGITSVPYYPVQFSPASGGGGGGGNGAPNSQPPQTKPRSVGCQVGQVAAGALSGAAGGAVTGGTLGGAEGAESGAIAGALVGAAVAYSSQGGFMAGVAAAIGSLTGHMTGGTNLANFTQVVGDTVGGMFGGNPALTIGSGAIFTGVSEGISAVPEGLGLVGPGVAEGLVAGGAGAAVGLLVNWGLTAGLHALGCP